MTGVLTIAAGVVLGGFVLYVLILLLADGGGMPFE